MSDVDAVRLSPTCAVPLMVGAPVAAEFCGTVNSSALDSFMLRMLQTAPSAAQSVVAGRDTETAVFPDGSTVISHRAFLPASSRRTLLTEPPVTVKALLFRSFA